MNGSGASGAQEFHNFCHCTCNYTGLGSGRISSASSNTIKDNLKKVMNSGLSGLLNSLGKAFLP